MRYKVILMKGLSVEEWIICDTPEAAAKEMADMIGFLDDDRYSIEIVPAGE